MNRNKRSAAINFQDKKGLKIIERLVSESDIFIENYIPGKLGSYGLGYEDLKLINPNLIYASLTGWGQEGRYAQRAGYDVIAASFGGLLSITGDADGSPARVGVAVTDLFTGVLTASAILAAQLDVRQGNGGSWIQSSLFHSQSAMLSHIAANYLTVGMNGKRYGTAHPSLVPYQSFMTADQKYLTIGAGNNNHFKQLCQLIELQSLPENEKFKNNGDRVANRIELIDLISSKIKQKTSDEWSKLFESTARFPWGPVNTIAEAYSDPELIKTVLNFPQTATREAISVPGSPVIFDKPLESPFGAPLLGQHTKEILLSLCYSESEIHELSKSKVIQL